MVHEQGAILQQDFLLLCTLLGSTRQMDETARSMVNKAVGAKDGERYGEGAGLLGLQELGRRLAHEFRVYATRLLYTEARVTLSMAAAGAVGGDQQQQPEQPGAAGGAAAVAAAAAAPPGPLCWRWQVQLMPSGDPQPAWKAKNVITVGLQAPRLLLVQPAADAACLDAGLLDLTTQGSSEAHLQALLGVAIPATLLLLQAQRSSLFHSGNEHLRLRTQQVPSDWHLHTLLASLDKQQPLEGPCGFTWLTRQGTAAAASDLQRVVEKVGMNGPAHDAGQQQG